MYDSKHSTLQHIHPQPRWLAFVCAALALALTATAQAQPAISVHDASVVEGDSSGQNVVLRFSLTLTAPSDTNVSVRYRTTNGTAVSGADFVGVSNALATIAAGSTEGFAEIAIGEDLTVESDETFTVTLFSPVNATIGNATATGTILNDEDDVTVSIGDASVVEGDSTTENVVLRFPVTLSGPANKNVTVRYATTSGSATAGVDFVSVSAALVTIPAGATQAFAEIAIGEDLIPEGDETLSVTLSSPGNATIGVGTAGGTILDDEDDVTLSIGDASVVEGDSPTEDVVLRFPLTLSAPATKSVTVRYLTSNGTAVSGADFVGLSNALVTIPAGATTAFAEVAIGEDLTGEADKTFTVTLSAPGNATIGNGTAIGTIVDDDEVPTAADDAYETAEDEPLSVPAPGLLGNDSDSDAGDVNATVVNGPTHGTLTLNGDGSFTYTPEANFNGNDSFTYVVIDDPHASNPAAVAIAVSAVNDAPVAAGDGYETNEDTPLSIAGPGVLENDADTDQQTLTATLVAAPAHGALVLNGDGSFTYVPDPDFSGGDSFTYAAEDGEASSEPATVAIVVHDVNTAPVAVDDGYSTAPETALSVAAPGVLENDSDQDADSLTAVLVGAPTHGELTLEADGAFTYTPNEDFTGEDSFSYQASDGTVDSNVATVTITVDPLDYSLTAEVVDGPDVNDDGHVDLAVRTRAYGLDYCYAVELERSAQAPATTVRDRLGHGWDLECLTSAPDEPATADSGGGWYGGCHTDIEWLPSPERTLSTLEVCVERYRAPSSCGSLELHEGAEAFELPVEGDPVAESNVLCIAVVEDRDGDGRIDRTGAGDEDRDGLTDLDEACQIGTNPCRRDTDGDGYRDGVEFDAGTDPLDCRSHP